MFGASTTAFATRAFAAVTGRFATKFAWAFATHAFFITTRFTHGFLLFEPIQLLSIPIIPD